MCTYLTLWYFVFTVAPIIAHSLESCPLECCPLEQCPLTTLEPDTETGEPRDTKREEPDAKEAEGVDPVVQPPNDPEMSESQQQLSRIASVGDSEGPPLLERSFSLDDIKPTKEKVVILIHQMLIQKKSGCSSELLLSYSHHQSGDRALRTTLERPEKDLKRYNL